VNAALKLHEEKRSAACKCFSVTGDKMHFSNIHDQNCLLANVYTELDVVGFLFLKVLMALICSHRLPKHCCIFLSAYIKSF
jgi:hypothetical protein